MPIKDFWDSLAPRARGGIAAGAAVIIALLVSASVWLLRTDWQVLFAELKPQDTAVMVAELDRMKVPYRIAADGNTILVDAAIVHSTRLKLMGRDMPLHGTAGFELFNNADFGMTEFAQKINYQRALQGEITRTILSLAEVRDARVHLALPEEGLFKRNKDKSKAAITLTLKPGDTLRGEQIGGIQRLVAAAVPGIAAQDVTIVDQQGVALTRAAPGDGELDAGAGAGRLDLKRDTEKLLARKATDVLARAFGAGQVLASVDVTLNMDQVRVTTEDVLAAPGHGAAATGVIVRERESAHDVGPPLGHGESALRGANTQREVEYQVGRRVEQLATQPGAIRRLNVLAVVRQSLDDKQLEQMRELVAAAVGALPERGDSVVVQSLHAFEPAPVQDEVANSAATRAASPRATAAATPLAAPLVLSGLWALLAGAMLVAAGAIAAIWRSRRDAAPPTMNAQQREALLEKLQEWTHARGDAA